MQPDNRYTNSQIPPRDGATINPGPARANEAAANIARSQIDAIFGEPVQQRADVAPQTTSQPQANTQTNPYDRNYDRESLQADKKTWENYHSAWQNYYQQYYERYYVGAVQQAHAQVQASQPDDGTISEDEALTDLRSRIRSNMVASARKVRGSRHFMPIIAAVCVAMIFMFLQYNRVLFANVQAFVSPGNINPANIIVDANSGAVGPEPKLIIPKINVEVPIDFNATNDHKGQMKAMENGVAYFGIPGANAKPGEVGNTPIAGHSSNDIMDGGNYKFIFVRLDQMVKGDTFMINYNSKRYVYTITSTQVVKPTDVAALTAPTDKPLVTLITCTPVGTAQNRLLVTAEQVSPDPSSAPKATGAAAAVEAPKNMTGNSPSFLQRIFGGGGGS